MKFNSYKGFTLLELMVALAVLAVVTASVMGRNGETVNQLYRLERQTIAHTVLNSHLARVRLEQVVSKSPVRIGSRSEMYYLGDRTWEIVTNVRSVNGSEIRRLDMEIFLIQDDVGPISIDSLIAFVGKS